MTRGVQPIQLALAGMNAHINHDLALALVATCRARRREPESGSIHADFEKVNAVLAEVVRPIRRSFLDEAVVRYGAGASPAGGPGVELLHRQGPGRRVGLRADPVAPARCPVRARAVRDSLARTVGLVSRQLLTVVELD